MENEINKIKIEYQSITPPKDLFTNGVDDLWLRVDSKKHFLNMYLPHIVVGILIFVILSGFIGIASANAKPGSVLYPVKVFTQNAVTAISKTPIIKFYNSQINQEKATEKNFQQTPLSSPTPKIKTEPVSENNNDDFKNEEKNNSESNQNQNLNPEDVKGVSVFENSNRKNGNSENNESQNHSSQGNNNTQNQNKENNSNQNNENRNQGKD